MKDEWSWIAWINEFTAAIAANVALAWLLKKKVVTIINTVADACRRPKKKDKENDNG